MAENDIPGAGTPPPSPVGHRDCHFVGVDGALSTPLYDEAALEAGTEIDGPAIVVTRATTYLVEPGWRFRAAEQKAVWFTAIEGATPNTRSQS